MPTSVRTVLPQQLDDPAFAESWERLRQRSQLPTAFTTLPFARAAAEALGYTLHAWIAEDDGTELGGGVLCFTRRMGPYSRIVVPPFVQYTPVLIARPSDEHEVHSGHSTLQAILTRLCASYGAVELNLLPEVCDLRPAAWAGFHARPLYTYRIPLPSGHSVQQTWSENAQRLFRRFVENYEFRSSPAYADEVIGLCAAGYERHGRALPVAAQRLARLVDVLHHRGLVKVFTLHARSEDVCEAGVVVLHDDAVAHYWIAGSRPGPAMTVLLGHVLDWVIQAGIGIFDFVGANTPSIAEFKRRFGPQLVPYHRIEHRSAIGIRMLDFVRGRRT